MQGDFLIFWFTYCSVEGLEYQEEIGLYDFLLKSNSSFVAKAKSTPNSIWYYNKDNIKVPELGPGPYLPVWETSPILHGGKRANENLMRLNVTQSPFKAYQTGHIMISELITAPPGYMNSDHHQTAIFALLRSVAEDKVIKYEGEPMSLVSIPIFNIFAQNRTTSRVLVSWINWALYFEDILTYTIRGIVMVLSDSCGGQFTFEIRGEEVAFLGQGDRHSHAYNRKRVAARFKQNQIIDDGTTRGVALNQQGCRIALDIYPSKEFYSSFKMNTPIVITVVVAIIFIFTAVMFLLYNWLVK